MIEKQNDLKEVIVHLRTPSGAPPTGPRDLSGNKDILYTCFIVCLPQVRLRLLER